VTRFNINLVKFWTRTYPAIHQLNTVNSLLQFFT